MQTIERYGVHWASGVAYLHQQHSAVNVIGLKQGSPFTTTAKLRRQTCPHQISANAQLPAASLIDRFLHLVRTYDVVRFFLPIPADPPGVMVLRMQPEWEELHGLQILSRLCSPLTQQTLWAAHHSVETISALLTLTNLSPLVVVAHSYEESERVHELARAAALQPRKLLLVVPPGTPLRPTMMPMSRDYEAFRADVNLGDLVTQPLESLGAMVLRAYMRRSWDHETFQATKEEVPHGV